MLKFWAFILLFITVNSTALAHEYYLGIAKIEYNETAHSFEVAVKLTAHDFDAVMEDMGFGNLHLGEKNESEKTPAILEKYILNELNISVNGVELTPHVLGKEVSNDDELWIYIEYPLAPSEKIEEVKIKNTLLMDQFPKQQNHNHLKIKGSSFALVCTRQRSSGIIYSVKKSDD